MRTVLSLRGRPLLARGDQLVYSVKDRLYSLESGVVRPLGRLAAATHPLSWAPSLVDRLARNEVSHYRVLADGTELAVHRRRFLVRRPGAPDFSVAHVLGRGSRPLVISVEDQGRLVFGEYGTLPRDQPVRIYAASGPDFSPHPVHEFPAGTIKHIHGVIWDPHDLCYWVTVGDADDEAGILRMTRDFGSVEWLVRGGQQTRAVGLMVFGDHLVYGTDSERAANHVIHLDKASGRMTRLHPLAGSCLHCGRFGEWMVVATACEPSQVNLGRECHLLASKDAANWARIASATKDRWDPTYFQFGTFVLPHAESPRFLAYAGQALSGWHGRLVVTDPVASWK